MKNKYKHSFANIWFYNRWLHRKYSRTDSWTIVGIRKHWASSSDYAYYFCFFGLEMSIWFKRQYIEK